jgi:hypothetical protein
LLVGLGVAISVALFLYASLYYNQKFNEKFGDVTRVRKSEMLNFRFKLKNQYKGYSYIELTNSRILVIEDLRNSLYRPKTFRDIVGSCDSIAKYSNSDSISIFSSRSQRKYRFKLLYDD